MTQWLKSGTRRACIFVRHACISGVLLAALAGCNDSDEAQTTQSTFETAQSGQTPVIDETNVPEEPVIGIVTEVEGTQHDPKTDGGDPAPVTEEDKPTVIVDPPPLEFPDPIVETFVMPVPEKATRFTETAPDTIGGATFHASAVLDYQLGNLVASTGGTLGSTFSDDRAFVTPVKGWMRYPEDGVSSSVTATRLPVIILLHGNHIQADPSYQGYDYLAEELATHGYVVLSIDANAINGFGGGDGSGDQSSQSRAQLVLGTLDRLRQVDAFGQIGEDGNPGPLDLLKGKLDFDRIGIMGHSRGGQGVSYAIEFNQTRLGVHSENLKDALKLSVQILPKISSAELTAALAGDSTAMSRLRMAHGAAALNAIAFKKDYPDLLAAVTLAGTSGTPKVDETKFMEASRKYNIFYAIGNEQDAPPPYDFKGAFMLAPTDFYGNIGLNHVPLAALLPSCDGDVANLDGVLAYDHNRFGPAIDMTPRYQILIRGANHNFYNTKWPIDDLDSTDKMPYCEDGRPNDIRLDAEDQRRGGNFIINSFMRYHVGGEQKFAAYWSGTAQLPGAACPSGQGPCDERVVLTVQKDDKRRKLIQRFEWTDSLRRNLLGGVIMFNGFSATARCDMPYGASATVGNCSPERLEGFGYRIERGKGLLSIADHAELAWSRPDAAIVTDLTGISAKGYDSLTFRVAVVRPMGQEVMVTLTDSAGNAATVTASDFSDALYNAPRPKGEGRPLVDDPLDASWATGQVSMLMNMVAIPLKAFYGVDTTSLKELKLAFPKESGKVAITDIELQNLGREKPAQQVARQ